MKSNPLPCKSNIKHKVGSTSHLLWHVFLTWTHDPRHQMSPTLRDSSYIFVSISIVKSCENKKFITLFQMIFSTTPPLLPATSSNL